jgi:hypothetical protein
VWSLIYAFIAKIFVFFQNITTDFSAIFFREWLKGVESQFWAIYHIYVLGYFTQKCPLIILIFQARFRMMQNLVREIRICHYSGLHLFNLFLLRRATVKIPISLDKVESMFWIRDILVRIKILGSVPLTRGSGYRSCSLVSDLQDANNKFFF